MSQCLPTHVSLGVSRRVKLFYWPNRSSETYEVVSERLPFRRWSVCLISDRPGRVWGPHENTSRKRWCEITRDVVSWLPHSLNETSEVQVYYDSLRVKEVTTYEPFTGKGDTGIWIFEDSNDLPDRRSSNPHCYYIKSTTSGFRLPWDYRRRRFRKRTSRKKRVRTGDVLTREESKTFSNSDNLFYVSQIFGSTNTTDFTWPFLLLRGIGYQSSPTESGFQHLEPPLTSTHLWLPPTSVPCKGRGKNCSRGCSTPSVLRTKGSEGTKILTGLLW